MVSGSSKRRRRRERRAAAAAEEVDDRSDGCHREKPPAAPVNSEKETKRNLFRQKWGDLRQWYLSLYLAGGKTDPELALACQTGVPVLLVKEYFDAPCYYKR